MKKVFFVFAFLTLILGMYVVAPAQPPINGNKKVVTKPVVENPISNADEKVLNTFEPREETENYLENRKTIGTSVPIPKKVVYVEPVEYINYNWVRSLGERTLTIKVLVVHGNDEQNMLEVWTTSDKRVNLPYQTFAVAKSASNFEINQTDKKIIISYLSCSGPVTIELQ